MHKKIFTCGLDFKELKFSDLETPKNNNDWYSFANKIKEDIISKKEHK